MGPSLLLVGCGKMGGALVDGWLAAGVTDRVTVVDPAPPPDGALEEATTNVRRLAGAGQLGANERFDVVVLAVKPQLMAEVVPAYRGMVGAGTLVVSIAAGTPIGFFETAFGADRAIVRAMPNTPAAVGRGITVAKANPRVTDRQRVVAGRLLGAVGEVAWLDDEGLIDPATAVSGSGPAYVFLMIEALAEAGAAAGLAPALAARLARATVIGAAELARQRDAAPAELRRAVTSPGGTTAAALSVLMDEPGSMHTLMTQAVAAGTARARELAG